MLKSKETMMRPLPIASRRVFAILALGASFSISSCSNASVAPTAHSAVAPAVTSGGYQWLEEDWPGSSDNQVTGINDNQELIGNWSNDGGTTWASYIAKAGHAQSYKPVTYPVAKITYMYAIDDGGDTMVGYVGTPHDETGNWGTVDYKGLWSLVPRASKETQCGSKDKFALLELLGYDNSANQNAVGFYTYGSTGGCAQIPIEVAPADKIIDLPLYNTIKAGNNQATGIDSNDDIVGTFYPAGTGKNSTGWLLLKGSTEPTPIQCCATKKYSTVFSGIAIKGSAGPVIVGNYTDGTSVHGFVYTVNTKQWAAPINEPNAQGYTTINGINDSGDICGWYRKSPSGANYGFVGEPVSAPRKPR